MTSINNTVFDWYNKTINPSGIPASGMVGIEATGFARLLESLSGEGGSSSGASFMDYLSRRFPGVDFSNDSVGETPEDVRDAFGADEGDNVAVEPEAAEAMAGNASLAGIFESMLAAFRDAAGQTQALEGAHVQRNIIATRVTVRFSISQIDTRSGETLSMNELKSAFTDRLQELAEKFFGGAGGADETAEAPADGENTQAEAASGDADAFAGFFSGSFGFNMYFSNSYLASQRAASAYASGEEFGFSALDFRAAFSAQGNFQNYANTTFSSAILSGLMSGGFGGGAFTSMLDSGLGMFGLSGQGAWQTGGGYSFQFGGGRNFLAELMSLYNGGASGAGRADPPASSGAAPEPAPAGEPEPAEALA